jgi:4-hydroxy-tetrahydrodipicolinate synthase
MFKGSLVAVVTPMHADGSMDKKSLGDLLEWQISQGTDGIVINGTTGEAPTLNPAELQDIIRFTVDCVHNRLPVIVGTGTNCTTKTIESTQEAFGLGADACLVVVPYYNRPMQEGLYQHYHAIAEAVSGPLVLYNHPGRTGCDLLPETLERLLFLPNIVGIKECASVARYAELIEKFGDQLDILTGVDSDMLPLFKLGGKGVISVTANIVPARMSELCRAALAADWETATAIDQQLSALHDALSLETNPIPVKWALHKMGKIAEGIRLPLTPLGNIHHATLDAALQQAHAL